MSGSSGAALTRALALGRDRLAGSDDPPREARLLLAHAAGVEPGRLAGLDDAAFTADLLAQFESLLDRRARGEPISHIRGYRDFWKYRFQVTADVLDPRPETEVLVDLALREPFSRVLDLGTGSGAILVSLLAERPVATGVGTDISSAALLVAGDNAARQGVEDRAIFTPSDWYADIGGRFDLIVSNPPYIASGEMAGLSREVREFEPHLALTDGADGLTAYRAIAAGAHVHLTVGGRLMVEIGWTQGPAVVDLFRAAGLEEVAIHPDLDGRDRVVSARNPA